MPHPALCEHPAWEYSVVITDVEGSTSQAAMRYYTVDVAVRCADCQASLVFEGLQAVHPQVPLSIGTLEAGTVLRVKALTLPPAPRLGHQWVRVPPPQEAEEAWPPAAPEPAVLPDALAPERQDD